MDASVLDKKRLTSYYSLSSAINTDTWLESLPRCREAEMFFLKLKNTKKVTENEGRREV